ncbi:MAG: GTPase HflX [Chloroflexota bacterium]
MSAKQVKDINNSPEVAIIVGVELPTTDQLLTMEDSVEELELLAETAGLVISGVVTQRLNRINPKTLIGIGKIEEIKALSDELDANVILFDDELSPRHQRELEKLFGDVKRVIDRTTLILDIFAQHASTHEGALQVELAQLEYRLPRLTRAWTHLARQAGGGGGSAGSVGGVGLRGPGEKQIESDKREINLKVDRLKDELDKVRAHRGRYRAKRKKSRIPVVALVGYTNAGKSTLLNKLSNSKVYVADQLFATLDPTTRRIILPGGQAALLTDTVGFIQKLPTTLVAAFRATLEEIAEAELLLHVIDISHANASEHALAVQETLLEIEASHIPVLTVINKIDLLSNPAKAEKAIAAFPNAVAVSALRNEGFDDLLNSINQKLYESYTRLTVKLPFSEGSLISMFHDQGKVDKIEHNRHGVIIQGRLPGRLVARYRKFQTKMSAPIPQT